MVEYVQTVMYVKLQNGEKLFIDKKELNTCVWFHGVPAVFVCCSGCLLGLIKYNPLQIYCRLGLFFNASLWDTPKE